MTPTRKQIDAEAKRLCDVVCLSKISYKSLPCYGDLGRANAESFIALARESLRKDAEIVELNQQLQQWEAQAGRKRAK